MSTMNLEAMGKSVLYNMMTTICPNNGKEQVKDCEYV